MAEMPPQLSVVVCTHNRPDDLERCLDALARLDDKPQVIVVDSATEPPAKRSSLATRDALPGLVYEYESEPGSPGRETGASRASGSIVAFLDDDAAPHRDWSRAILAPFRSGRQDRMRGRRTCAAAFEPEAGTAAMALRSTPPVRKGITRFGDVARPARSRARMAVRREHGVPRLRTRLRPVRRRARPKRHDAPGEESALVERLGAVGWTVCWLEPRAIVDHTVTRERCRSSYYWRRLWWAG